MSWFHSQQNNNYRENVGLSDLHFDQSDGASIDQRDDEESDEGTGHVPGFLSPVLRNSFRTGLIHE